MSEEFNQAKATLVNSLIVYLQAGERAGKTQAELTGEFMAAFGQAAQEVQAAA